MATTPTVPPPAPCGPVPSARQQRHARRGFYGFIHFTVNTFTDREWGLGDEPPTRFDPSACDPRQWARTARAAGMTGLIMTCKHHDGFCLWPTRTTAHSVKNSPWKGGKGDLVRDFADACRAEGLEVGVYLSPWDRNHAEYGRPAYIKAYREQLRELLTGYGPLFEVWFDGANGGDGYYGGAREARRIDASTYYDWPTTHRMVRELQPDAVMFSDAGPDIRWVGNESGIGSETTWCPLRGAGRYPGQHGAANLGCGEEDGDVWLQPEVDVSIRPGWFWHAHEDAEVKTVAHLLDIWYASVGRGCTLLLNLPPDRRGLIHETDCARLAQMRSILDGIYRTDLAPAAVVAVSEVRGGDSAYGAARVIDGDPATYWATSDGVTAGHIDFAFAKPTAVNHLEAQEAIALGQRVQEWAVEVLTSGAWRQVATGTTIGGNRLVRFPTVTADVVRLRIVRARAAIALARVRLFNAPAVLRDPRITRDRQGRVVIDAGDGAVVRYTLDGSLPGAGSPLYREPFALPRSGGTVTVAALPADNPGAVALGADGAASRRFGYAKTNWTATASSEETAHEDGRAANAIDERPDSFWRSAWSGGVQPGPWHLDLDLGEALAIGALVYQPRNDPGWRYGLAERYRVQVSDDGRTWGAPVAEGRFDNIAANPVEQRIALAAPVTARFVRFTVLAAVDGVQGASVAGFHVFPPA